MVSGARGIPEYGRLYRNMGEYRTSEVRQSGTAEEEEEGGEEGGERYIYIRISKIYTEKRTRRKRMERNRPDWQGGEGAEAFGVDAKKAQLPRAWRTSGNDYHCSGDGRV